MAELIVQIKPKNTNIAIEGAKISFGGQDKGKTDNAGKATLSNVTGSAKVGTRVFGVPVERDADVTAGQSVILTPNLGEIALEVENLTRSNDYFTEGDILSVRIGGGFQGKEIGAHLWTVTGGTINSDKAERLTWQPDAGDQTVALTITDKEGASLKVAETIKVFKQTGPPSPLKSDDSVSVNLSRGATSPTPDQMLWVSIRNRTKAIAFSGSGYDAFIDAVLGQGSLPGRNANRIQRQADELEYPVHGVGAYELLKTATQVFLLLECGFAIQGHDATNHRLFYEDAEQNRLGRKITLQEARSQLEGYLGSNRAPYINRVLDTAFKGSNLIRDGIFSSGLLASRADCPLLIELIWSYWHEEAMMVQAMNAISLRFQNKRGSGSRDPLAHLEIAPLYPLNNLLWGYIQDEVHSLSVARRNYEYNHHYGLQLHGTAVSNFRPADTRSHFIEGFHNLLHQAARFYKQADDTTYIPDGFPLYNNLREVHMVLAEGAHNQFGDLPWTARAEMLMQQWLLSRPELRQFLQSRAMVPYRESWMPQVDTMKQLQGWTDVSVTHFNYLATCGEQILLSIRYGDWVSVDNPAASAANWANYWRPEIQNYIHSYRTVTGVDLGAEANDSRQAEMRAVQPSQLLLERLTARKPALTFSTNGKATTPSGFRQRREERAATRK